jgi:hypothetical protein
MTWLTWRQFRVSAASVFFALAALGVVLAITGPQLVGSTDFSDVEFLYGATIFAPYLLTAAVGVFWGVPMVTRELETGTHSLVWNQTVTRGRWLAAKLGVGVLAAMLVAGLLCLAVNWWASPIDALASLEVDADLLARITPLAFGARGIAPIGYAAFALVLGVAVGIALRRTVAAMAVALVVFVAVQVAVPFLVRPYVLPAVAETVTITNTNIREIRGDSAGVLESLTVAEPAGAWVLANETVDSAGNVASPMPEVAQGCLAPPSGDRPGPAHGNVVECLAGGLSDGGYQQRLTYQPGDRFWPIQWIETAMFLALSGLLAWFCFRRIRHLS